MERKFLSAMTIALILLLIGLAIAKSLRRQKLPSAPGQVDTSLEIVPKHESVPEVKLFRMDSRPVNPLFLKEQKDAARPSMPAVPEVDWETVNEVLENDVNGQFDSMKRALQIMGYTPQPTRGKINLEQPATDNSKF